MSSGRSEVMTALTIIRSVGSSMLSQATSTGHDFDFGHGGDINHRWRRTHKLAAPSVRRAFLRRSHDAEEDVIRSRKWTAPNPEGAWYFLKCHAPGNVAYNETEGRRSLTHYWKEVTSCATSGYWWPWPGWCWVRPCWSWLARKHVSPGGRRGSRHRGSRRGQFAHCPEAGQHADAHAPADARSTARRQLIVNGSFEDGWTTCRRLRVS